MPIFETASRRFILADAPGHEQYTRNMATGASTADVAMLLVDARKGLLAQTRRHAAIVWLRDLMKRTFENYPDVKRDHPAEPRPRRH